MAKQKTNPALMKVGDQVFWDEFNQIERPADRYVVVDSKNQKIVVQNARLVREVKKIKV